MAVTNLKFVLLIRQEFENYKELLFKKRQGKNVLLSDLLASRPFKTVGDGESPLSAFITMKHRQLQLPKATDCR